MIWNLVVRWSHASVRPVLHHKASGHVSDGVWLVERDPIPRRVSVIDSTRLDRDRRTEHPTEIHCLNQHRNPVVRDPERGVFLRIVSDRLIRGVDLRERHLHRLSKRIHRLVGRAGFRLSDR